MIFEAGIQQCGPENSEMLTSALGQMRRSQTSVAGDEQVQWPGKGDETPYIASEHTFTRYSVPEPPPMCARGSLHKSGEGIVCVSNEPILDPAVRMGRLRGRSCSGRRLEARCKEGDYWHRQNLGASVS